MNKKELIEEMAREAKCTKVEASILSYLKHLHVTPDNVTKREIHQQENSVS